MSKLTCYLNNLAENLEQNPSLLYPYQQLMDVSRITKDDPKGQLLLDDFLEACFDSAPFLALPSTTDEEPRIPGSMEQLSASLQALNAHLTEQALLPGGIMPPPDLDLNEWAEDITMNILTNRPF